MLVELNSVTLYRRVGIFSYYAFIFKRSGSKADVDICLAALVFDFGGFMKVFKVTTPFTADGRS